MTNIIEDSFNLNIRVMSFFGLYPSQTHPTLQKVKGCTLYFALLILVTILVFINFFQEKDSDITRTNYMLSFIAETTFFFVKLAPFITQSRRIANCVNYFGHPRFVPKNDEARRIIKKCVKVCRRDSLIYFTVLSVALWSWIFQYVFTNQLPLDVWLPYNPRTGPIVFYLTFIFVSAALFYDCFSGTMMDPLIGGLAYHAKSQLKILVYNLQHLEENVNQKAEKHSFVNFEDVRDHLELCVEHHNHILNFVAEYEACFSFPVFSQISASMFMMGFCCIGVILAPAGSLNFFQSIAFVFLFTAQIFFYFYYGTLLFEENEGFMDAVCMGPWYNYDVKIRKTLILMMERSKRPMIVTAGKIVNLTLGTFVSLLKTSYSLITVLKSYY